MLLFNFRTNARAQPLVNAPTAECGMARSRLTTLSKIEPTRLDDKRHSYHSPPWFKDLVRRLRCPVAASAQSSPSECARQQVGVAFRIFVLCLIGYSLCPPANAAEGGTSAYLKGYKDFLSGVLPTVAGAYVRNDVIYYGGNIDATLIGGQLKLKVSQWSLSNLTSATFVTPVRVMGGTYAFGAIVPFTKADVKVGIDTGRGNVSSSDSVFNVDDIIVNPVMLGWSSGDFHWMALVSLAMPTALYNKERIANTGLNYWSVQPQFSMTYYEPKKGLDVSAGLTYVINTENHATGYLTGNLFHLDWATGKQLNPTWKIGAVGYLMEQVTGDSGSGATLGPDKASVWALGPAATYSFKVNKMPISVLGKWTHEIAAENTFRGDTVSAAISFRL